LLLSLLLLVPQAANAATNPGLGTAGSFAVLAATTVTNTGPTVVNGNLGVSPGNAVTGFPPGTVVGGTIHAGDAVAAQAQADALVAYNALAGQACNVNLTGQDLGGLTLTAGVYCFNSSAELTGPLILDAQGDPNAVFIFQIGSTLTTASSASVELINSADECNVFYQVGSSATLGTTTSFQGNILALTSITLNTGATEQGGLYALNGAVTLDSNVITAAVCNTQASTPTSTPTDAAVATNTPTSTPTDVPVPNTPVPETPVPETPVPNTPIPGTEVPLTPMPNTPVPNTPVPETPVPETPVPNTPIPGTEVPLTPMPNTPVPNTPVPNTPVPNTPVPTTNTTPTMPTGTVTTTPAQTPSTVSTPTTSPSTTNTPTAGQAPVGLPDTGASAPWQLVILLLLGASAIIGFGLVLRRRGLAR